MNLGPRGAPLRVVIGATPRQERERPPRERVRVQREAARAALQVAVAASVGRPLELRQADDGKPLPREGWHWSISHDATYVAAVVARAPVGVDLERIRLRRAELRERVLDEAERALLPAPAEDFCRAWTAKEAVLKATQDGISGLRACKIVEVPSDRALRLAYRGRDWIVVQQRVADHWFAIASNDGNEPEVDWQMPGDAGLPPPRPRQ